MKNDVALKMLGYDPNKCKAYRVLKGLEIQERNKKYGTQLKFEL